MTDALIEKMNFDAEEEKFDRVIKENEKHLCQICMCGFEEEDNSD